MKRTGIILLAIAGTLAGVAVAQIAPSDIGGKGKDDRTPLLHRINVMVNQGPMLIVPQDRFSIAIGDWIEISAALPQGSNNTGWPYPVEADIQGEAVEQFASVRPATLRQITTKQAGLKNVLAAGDGFAGQRHLFLRGIKAGKATVTTTVARSETWKEIREFEVTVTEEREAHQGFGFGESQGSQ